MVQKWDHEQIEKTCPTMDIITFLIFTPPLNLVILIELMQGWPSFLHIFKSLWWPNFWEKKISVMVVNDTIVGTPSCLVEGCQWSNSCSSKCLVWMRRNALGALWIFIQKSWRNLFLLVYLKTGEINKLWTILMACAEMGKILLLLEKRWKKLGAFFGKKTRWKRQQHSFDRTEMERERKEEKKCRLKKGPFRKSKNCFHRLDLLLLLRTFHLSSIFLASHASRDRAWFFWCKGQLFICRTNAGL